MKYLLVLVVVVFMGWILLGRKGGRGSSDADSGQGDDRSEPRPRAGKATKTALMVHCAHCGIHLPDTESVANKQGQRFCNEAHRLAGPS